MNHWRGVYTLFSKEVLRFMKVTVQTILTPVITALLYLLIFSHVMEERVQVYPGISYGEFLVPGLIMMSVIQNAFANSSSSLIQSKMTRNLIFLLLSPISVNGFYLAFVAAAVMRGLLVGAGICLVSIFFVDLPYYNVLWLLMFSIIGSAVLGAMGIIAGIWAEKFDQLAAFQNFVILPLSFLSGVFYSINTLPEIWADISRFNPFFYMIDGFRYGVLGVSDVSPWLSFSVVFGFFILISVACLIMLRSGYKLRD